MNISKKRMIKIIGEQLARIIELNEYIDAADSAFSVIQKENNEIKVKR